MARQKKMLRITRVDGRENFIAQAMEKNFMLNILNKTDRKVTKVERGTLMISGESREFLPEETIYISKNQETKEIAKAALAIAKEKDAENQALREQLDALKAGGAGGNTEELEKARQAAMAATEEAGSAAEKAKVLEFTVQSKEEELKRQASEIEALKAQLAAAEKPAAEKSAKKPVPEKTA